MSKSVDALEGDSMKLYRVANWDRFYETHDTRKLVRLSWTPFPNKHDGLGFRMIAAEKDAPDLFAAWILMVQLASKSDRSSRGVLSRDGAPLDASAMAMMTGFPENIFTRALVFFSQARMGWLLVEQTQAELPLSPDNLPESPGTPVISPGRMEGNGKKGIEIKEGAEAAKPRDRNLLFDALCLFENTPVDQVGKAAGRIVAAIRDIRASSPDVTPEEIARRGENYKTLFTVTPTANGLASHWGKCHEPAPKRSFNGSVVAPVRLGQNLT